jgi:hypothetical protein
VLVPDFNKLFLIRSDHAGDHQRRAFLDSHLVRLFF